MISRDHILHRVRTALGRSAGQVPSDLPPARIRVTAVTVENRVGMMLERVQALAGKTRRVSNTVDARAFVESELAGKTAVASNSRFLKDCGITALNSVRSNITDRETLRQVCATADIAITSADYALADTGTLVMLSSPEEARLVSLLPPAHLAIVPRERILSGLDELLDILPNPNAQASSMVLITGPSRTADIEQILVRGVHGPGEITVVVVG